MLVPTSCNQLSQLDTLSTFLQLVLECIQPSISEQLVLSANGPVRLFTPRARCTLSSHIQQKERSRRRELRLTGASGA